MPKIKIVPVNEWPIGKSDVTEYDKEKRIINVRSDYDYVKDPQGWIVHELKHHELNLTGFKDDDKEYPYNDVERQAYESQFKHLKKLGVNHWRDVIKNKDQHSKVLERYWDLI